MFLIPLADGRFGVARVIRTKTSPGRDAAALVVPSSWIGSNPERPSDKDIRSPLMLTHHSWVNHREAVWVGCPPPSTFVPIGQIELTSADHAIECEAYSGWESGQFQILRQWRWDHDRESLLAEEAVEKEKEAEKRKIAAERYAEMLRTLTLENVSDRVWFDSWDEELDGKYLPLSRGLISNLILNLRAEPKLTKTVVRRLLKATVSEFNRLDATSHFIETTHREDICEALELVMCAAGYSELADEVEGWRDW